MSIEDEIYGRSSKTTNFPTMQKRAKAKEPVLDITGRNFIFNTLMPGVFLFLVYYHFFVFNPYLSEFYGHQFIKLVYLSDSFKGLCSDLFRIVSRT